MIYSDPVIWGLIIAIGIGTHLIRFSFLGAFGRLAFPPCALRLLRYTAVAAIPDLVAPLVVWPQATGATPIRSD